ncbi:hypothetical protein VTJ04DRAFT_3995 [Mycothermus thermophilus]|uniref:uncharacterized protein n=1 Tax=Humicola insolens TaxID=85995 RepID=UPI0037449CBA
MAASSSSSPRTPRSVRALLNFALAVLPFVVLFNNAIAPSNAQFIDCYKFDGTLSPNNTRCPGSNACCGPKSTCLSNRLCTADEDPNSTSKPVRGPCAVKGWDPTCAQICMYNEEERYPRVKTCEDGSFCCDNDPYCCERGLGIFLDESGNVVSARATGALTRYPPLPGYESRYTLLPFAENATVHTAAPTSAGTQTTQTQSTVVTTTQPSSSAATGSNADSASPGAPTSGSSSDPDADASSDDPETAAASSDPQLPLKLGLGLGIPLAVLVLAGILFLVFRLGRLAGREEATETAAATASGPGSEEGMSSTTYTNNAMYPDMAYQWNRQMEPVEIGGQMAVEIMPSEKGQTASYPVNAVEIGGNDAVEIMTHSPRLKPVEPVEPVEPMLVPPPATTTTITTHYYA